MPSPFPGMDPWLEDPKHWPGVHTQLVTAIGDAMNASLPKNYYAEIEERLYVCQPDDPVTRMIVPDVIIREHQRILERASSTSVVTQGSTATLQAPIVEPLEIRERRVVIRTVDKNRVVTVIELLSPANKTRGSKGRRHYIRKRNNVLDSSAHFVEIDLLRGGERFEGYTKLPPSDYLIAVSREPIRPTADWWLVPPGATLARDSNPAPQRGRRHSARPASGPQHRLRPQRLRSPPALRPTTRTAADSRSNRVGQ